MTDSDEGAANRSRFKDVLTAIAVALTCLLPFAKMLRLGQSFYFRDIGASFIPDRLYILQHMLRGQTAYWNPLVHEGEPSFGGSAWDYPLNLLQLLMPSEFGISVFLVLHIPFAALAFLALLRDLGIRPLAGSVGALVYALGGYSLSLINLYVYVPTLAWGPLFILAFRRAVQAGGSRAVAVAAFAHGMLVTSGGLEIALQACAIGVLMAPPSNPGRFLRSAVVAVLGLGLSAAVIAPTLGVLGASARAQGMPTAEVLGFSVPPMVFLQTAIANLFGNPVNIWTEWWGVKFFSNLYPYILSLYVGPLVLALAAAGLFTRRTYVGRFVLVIAAAVVVCLGANVFWGSFLDLSPRLRFLRFPVKAFYSVQFGLAVLASFATDAILGGTREALRRSAVVAAAASGLFASLILAPAMAPQATRWFMNQLLPGVGQILHDQIASTITRDAALGGSFAFVAAFVLLLTLRGRLSPPLAAAVLAALVAADLIRAGAGLNPAASRTFFEISPEMRAHLPLLRSGGRTFSCEVLAAQTYREAIHAGISDPNDLTWMAFKDTLSPEHNLREGVPTALSIDHKMTVPMERVLIPDLAGCRNFPFIAPRLRSAGVDRVISLDPLSDPDLRLLAEVAPRRIAPAIVHIYELAGAAPRFSHAVTPVRDDPDRVVLDVTLDQAATFVLRDPWAPGWTAEVDGIEAPIIPTPDGHRSLALRKGVSRVDMRYEPPNLKTGIRITLASFFACGAFFVFGGRRARASSGL
jgi:hypothetical protein